ncbi:transcriptional regulator sugar kinase [Agrilactobacillus composti DSM 18527 = JCM 14202]|uniref:Transcriptional regulator sugar kinase n=1 Tax=Agrilactobacillus composti DSM 18527 = JCM 14202 TaxID=1423734 RepID=X0PVZ8_9LACO|nr:ROK family protein [Agrilactobacillus composti]KRM36118.1 transcriptional regulator sugar kinase [Agrilactobacillus composti DSM 18527 = JCM 14202]GAF41716.1 sugar kinase and transcription regulator [Agrilactobacillus composti DSM 18527 = JCM 14202]
MHDFLCIDIGGTNLKYAVINHAGEMIIHDKVKTPAQDLGTFMAVIYRILDQHSQHISGIAISVPGQVDPATGIVYHGGSLPFLDKINFPELIHKRYGLEISVHVENDGKAGALAELWLGSLKDVQNGAAIILGTGVGGGLILNGQLFYGSHFQAGELSFMFTDTSQSMNRGIVGINASAVGMVKTIADKIGLPKNQDNGLAVFQHIQNGDSRAVIPFQQYCRNVAYLILNIQTVVDLTTFAIGGGISRQGIVTETINAQYDALLNENMIVKESLSRPKIKQAAFGNDANLFGALYSLFMAQDHTGMAEKNIS